MRTLTVSGLRAQIGSKALICGFSMDLWGLDRAGAVGLIGASGAGKSLVLRALVGLAPPEIEVSGTMTIDGQPYDLARPGSLARLRGGVLALLSQSAAESLDPVRRLGAQVAEVQRRWADPRTPEAALVEVGLAPRVADLLAHQLSGGEAQRAALALALACSPAVILADEPTASLDPPRQQEILALLAGRCAERGMGLVLVSHDLAIVAERCARAVVLEQGAIVEEGPVWTLLRSPQHPATAALARAAQRAAAVRS